MGPGQGQHSIISMYKMGNHDSKKDLKGHKNLWLTIFPPLLMWHSLPHYINDFHFFTKLPATNRNTKGKKKTFNRTRMSEVKDSSMKLFGQTIPLSVLKFQQQQQQETFFNDQSVSSAAVDEGYCDRDCDPEASLLDETSHKELQEEEQQQEEKEHSGNNIIDDELEDSSSKLIKEDLKDPATSSGNSEIPKTSSVDRETSSLKSPKNGEQSESSTSQEEKTLKKPDKILPCPRCNSMDTKFCYYNNYNVNQPRHFCKNCQRYWTAGGTMRNVPVGAGRRKNKSSSASQYRQIMISEALRTVQANGSSGVHSPYFGNNDTVLALSSDSPLCESVPSVLNLSDKSQNCVRNGFHRPEPRIFVPGTNNGDDHSSGSSITASNSLEKGGNCASKDVKIKNYQGSTSQVPYFPGPPWSYLWNAPMPPPGFYPSGFPVSFYPKITYLGYADPGRWNIPYLPPNASSQSQYAPNFTPAIKTLGKHSRDGNIITPANLENEEPSRESNNSERSVLVPKTLKIDDPIEAAKSSIWATLGIKNKRTTSGEGLFKGFQSKSNDRNCIAETSAVLQANPAAISRSLNFRERT